MLTVDLHTHSLFSQCGLFTYMELLTRAKEIGVEVLAITDHGSAVGGRIPGTFLERVRQPVPEVQLLKGIECNVITRDGEIDLPEKHRHHLDLVLLGLHNNLPAKESMTTNSNLLFRAIEQNPQIDIITHPNDPNYPVEFKALAQLAKEKGIALEINNSKLLYNRVTEEYTLQMIEQFLAEEVQIVVSSDTHALHELGRDDEVRPLLERVGYPEDLIINRDSETALAFVESRRKFKL